MKEILIAKLTLDTFRRNKIAPLVVPKGDYGARVIQARIKDYGNPISVGIDDAVSIVAKRSSGGDSLAFSGRANQDGTVTVPVTQWMLDNPEDDVVCHIVVTGNDYQYSTTSFLIQPQEKENPAEISEDDPRVDVITEVLANENARISAENERVSSEEERKSNEEERKRFYEETKPLFVGVENFLTNNNIVQELGDSTTAVMSQAATTAAIGDVAETLIDVVGYGKVKPTVEKRYIATSGETVDLTAFVEADWTWDVFILDCAEGDNFTLTGTGGADPRLWCFIDENSNVISVSDELVTSVNEVITAPTNASKLIVNVKNTSKYYVINGLVIGDFETKTNEVLEQGLCESLDWKNGFYMVENGTWVDSDRYKTTDYFKSDVLPVVTGKKYAYGSTGYISLRYKGRYVGYYNNGEFHSHLHDGAVVEHIVFDAVSIMIGEEASLHYNEVNLVKNALDNSVLLTWKNGYYMVENGAWVESYDYKSTEYFRHKVIPTITNPELLANDSNSVISLKLNGRYVGFYRQNKYFLPSGTETDALYFDEVAFVVHENTDYRKICVVIGDFVKNTCDGFNPLEYGLPALYLTGDITEMNKDNAVTLKYWYNDERIGDCTLKWQGSSSVAYDKKNYTIKFDNSFEAKEGWGSQKKYCLKANWIDFSHARNVVSAKLWGAVVKSRSTPNEKLNALVNAGAVDGFPCVVIINGEYQGIYTFNIPKDGWMMAMGEGTREGIVCAEGGCPQCEFKSATATVAEDDAQFSLEYTTNEEDYGWMATSINRMIQACIDERGTTLDTLKTYLDMDSVIDYYIFTALLKGEDMASKNYLLGTYDGTKWFFSAYDMDSTYGLHWSGTHFLVADGGVETINNYPNTHRAMEVVKLYMKPQLKARYKELRNSVLSDDYVITTFANFIGSIPKALFDEEVKIWKGIPSTSTNNLSQIADFYKRRSALMDAEMEAL